MNGKLWMALALMPALAWLAVGQEPAVRERGKEARHVLKALAPFPEEVRNAVPVVAQEPALPGKIYELARKNDLEYIDKILVKYPKDVQEAAKLLCRTPEVLEIMAMHANLMRTVGELYKKEGLAPLKAIAQEIRAENAKAEASTIAWAKRLGDNRLALQQLFEATTALAQQQPGAEFTDYGFGLAYSKRDNTATVYALPAAPLTLYVLLNADLYTELADEMVEQWLHTDSDTDFDEVFQRGWEVYRQIYKDDFFHPDHRKQRLAAMAQLGKKLSATKKDGKVTLHERAQYLKEHVAEYPALARYADVNVEKLERPKDGETVAKPKVPRKPTPLKPYTPPPDKPAPEKVTQASPTPQQQTMRGSYATNYYWYYWNYYYYYPPYYGYYPWYYWSYAPVTNQPAWWWGGANRPVNPGIFPRMPGGIRR